MTRVELNEMTVAELRKLARPQGVVGASRMAKTDLVEAIGDAMGLPAEAPADPVVLELEEQTVMQLRREALDRGVVGAARMNKATLIELLAPLLAAGDATEAASVPPQEPAPAPAHREVSFGYPETYGIDRVVLLVRDPEWLYSYWDISGESWAKLIQRGITNPSNGWQRVLRLQDMTGRTLNGGGGSFVDVELDDVAREWYFQAPVPDRVYLVEFGYRSASGEFLVLARSNLVQVPRKAPSDDLDVRFGRLYDDALRLSLGGAADVLGVGSFPGSRAGEDVTERLSRLLEVSVSSSAFSGQAEPAKRG